MWDGLFLKRLRKEMPHWRERGWIEADGSEAILAELAARGGLSRFTPIVFAVLGVLLVGAGVILFFAANWQEMAKITKIAVLVGALIATHVAAGLSLARPGRASGAVAHALLLLGIILFGANIILIAQIYHIDRHYPDAILVWSLGALLVACLVPSEIALVAGLLLGLLWSGFETLDFGRHIHWPFLVLWLATVPLIWRNRWVWGARATMITLILWSILTFYWGFEWRDRSLERVFLAQVVLFGFLTLFWLLHVAVRRDAVSRVADAARLPALVGALLAFLALTGRYHYGLRSGSWLEGDSPPIASAAAGWVVASLVAMASSFAAAAWARRRAGARANGPSAVIGFVLLGLICLASLSNLARGLEMVPVLGIYIAFNVLFCGGLVWLIHQGYRQGDTAIVNTAFVFFAVLVLQLYFDTFWSLADRAYFFIGGGVVLFAGGYLLERQRRRLLSRGSMTRDTEDGA